MLNFAADLLMLSVAGIFFILIPLAGSRLSKTPLTENRYVARFSMRLRDTPADGVFDEYFKAVVKFSVIILFLMVILIFGF